MNKESYSIETHDHGYLMVIPNDQNGLATDRFVKATNQIEKLCDGGRIRPVIAMGVTNFYKEHENKNVLLAVCLPDQVEPWRKAIEDTLTANTALSDEDRWFYGTDTGMSSNSIFKVLANTHLRNRIEKAGSVPLDAADLGRCIRLCDRFNWNWRMGEVALAYKSRTKWPEIVAEWGALTTRTHDQQNYTLDKILHPR